jgi:hypothetical protein
MRRLAVLVIMMLPMGAVHAANTNDLDIAEKARTGSFVFKCEQVLDVKHPWTMTSMGKPEENSRFIHRWLAEDIDGMGSSELGKFQKKEMESVQSSLMQLFSTPPIISVTPEGYKKMIVSRLRTIAKRAGYQLTDDTKDSPIGIGTPLSERPSHTTNRTDRVISGSAAY